MNLTPWFPSEIKPVHVGAYLSYEYSDGSDFYRYWDGEHWGAASRTIENALPFSQSSFACQSNRWCGLARKP